MKIIACAAVSVLSFLAASQAFSAHGGRITDPMEPTSSVLSSSSGDLAGGTSDDRSAYGKGAGVSSALQITFAKPNHMIDPSVNHPLPASSKLSSSPGDLAGSTRDAKIASHKPHALPVPSKTIPSEGRLSFSIESQLSTPHGFTSIFNVANATNAATPVYTQTDPFVLNRQSTTGAAGELSYTFANQSELSVSYRYLGARYDPGTSQMYESVAQIMSTSTGTYTAASGGVGGHLWSTAALFGVNGTIGGVLDAAPNNLNAAYAVFNAQDTLTETSKLDYHQGNVDWGYRLHVAHGFSFKPYVGVGWRSIGYQDTMTFASESMVIGGGVATSANDYFATSDTITTVGSNPIQLGDTVNTDTTGYKSEELIKSASTDILIDARSTSGSANDTFYVNQNLESDVSTYDAYIGSNLPSYTSKFNGIGPRFGVKGEYTWGKYVAFVGELALTLPYGQQKTTGMTSSFNTEDVQGAGQTITNTTSVALGSGAGSLSRNVNLRVDGGSGTSFSYSNHRVIPEMELNAAIRFSTDDERKHRVTVFVDAGYRLIEDWSAFRRVNVTSLASVVKGWPGMSNLSNAGPYLKVGMTFGT